jgi:hypothetical protein
MSLLESELTMLFYRKTVTPAPSNPVLRIRDVYPRSRIRICPSRIPDPGSKRFRIPDPHQRILFFLFLTLKTVSNLSDKLSEMFFPDPVFFTSRIRDPVLFYPRFAVENNLDPNNG